MSNYESVAEYFDHISDRITEEQAKSLQGIFRFDIQGAGSWLIEFTDQGNVNSFDAQDPQDPQGEPEPDCTVSAKESDWLDVVSGRTKPMSAFVTGKLKVKGSTAKAMKLQQVIGS